MAPPLEDEDCTIRALEWRWDGRVLAAAYSTGDVVLREVETTDILHKTSLECDLSTMTWVKVRPEEGEAEAKGELPETQAKVTG